ncbi:hypothetical protein L0Y65_01150 [Candidatus Micrarchaeota archaeon]|nr:hypothetical protein [Candidatus Micrarchaeota archaeon]
MTVSDRRTGRRVSGAMSRGDFIRTAGVGAAALGAASMGFSGLGRAQQAVVPGTSCRFTPNAFDYVVPDGLTPIGVMPSPYPPYPIFIEHPNYSYVVQEAGEIFECPAVSDCIPQGHGLMWPLSPTGPFVGNNPLTDYTVGYLNPADMKVAAYFGSMDYGVAFNAFFRIPPSPAKYPIPTPSAPGGLNWGQAFAFQGAQVGFFTAEYPNDTNFNYSNGRFDSTGWVGPLSDVAQVKRPVAVDPSLASIEPWTTAVQFNVTCPYTAANTTLSRTPKNLKMFGWFISMRGAGYNLSNRPLVIHIGGITNYITQPTYKGPLAYVSGLAQLGYDVLYLDKPGHGWSEGKMTEFYPGMLFEILNQLHQGVYALGSGESVPSTKTLVAGQLQYGVNNAKKTNVILSGHSLGAFICQRCAVANIEPRYADLPWYQLPFTSDNRYKIVGVIDFEGLPGGMKFTSPGLFRAVVGGAAYAMTKGADGMAIIGRIATAPISSEIVSFLPNPKMPPMMFVTTTQNYQSPANAVLAYNLHKGLKRIYMYSGLHGSAMKLPPYGYVYNVIPEADRFIKDCIANIGNPVIDTSQADLKTLVCQALAIPPAQPDPSDMENGHGRKHWKDAMNEAAKNMQADAQQ